MIDFYGFHVGKYTSPMDAFFYKNFDALDNCHHHEEMRIPLLDLFRVSTRALQKEVIAPIYQLLSFRSKWGMQNPDTFHEASWLVYGLCK